MTAGLPLQLLDQERHHVAENHLSLEASVYAFLAHQEVNLDKLLEEPSLWKVQISEENILENWKTFLSLALLSYLLGKRPPELSVKWHALLRQPWQSSSQYLKAIMALSQCLMGMPVPDIHLQLLEGGAALLERHEYSPWSALTYQPLHAEFGTFLCVLASLTNKKDWQGSIQRLANWQLNTLGADGLPVAGLFTQERESERALVLMWNLLFFCAAAQVTGNPQLAHIAKLQLEHLECVAGQQSVRVPPLMLLLEKLLQAGTFAYDYRGQSLSLAERVYDPSMALVGFRSHPCHALCTLHGDHTGLGYFRLGDIQVVNYAPQYLPLGDCQGFGIEGNHFSDHGTRQTSIKEDSQGFGIKGCVRLVDQPLEHASPYSAFGAFRGIWMDIEQQFHRETLSLKISLLGFKGWEGVVMSFFVKAFYCDIGSQVKLLPQTLQRYEGPVQPVSFKGHQSSLNLISVNLNPTSMQVIPLGGGDNFWGADFLVAYTLDPQQRHYGWQIHP